MWQSFKHALFSCQFLLMMYVFSIKPSPCLWTYCPWFALSCLSPLKHDRMRRAVVAQWNFLFFYWTVNKHVHTYTNTQRQTSSDHCIWKNIQWCHCWNIQERLKEMTVLTDSHTKTIQRCIHTHTDTHTCKLRVCNSVCASVCKCVLHWKPLQLVFHLSKVLFTFCTTWRHIMFYLSKTKCVISENIV